MLTSIPLRAFRAGGLAAGLAAFALATAAADTGMDYGLGAFQTIDAWRAAGQLEVPMDYGLGSFATVEQWRSAGWRPHHAGTAAASRSTTPTPLTLAQGNAR